MKARKRSSYSHTYCHKLSYCQTVSFKNHWTILALELGGTAPCKNTKTTAWRWRHSSKVPRSPKVTASPAEPSVRTISLYPASEPIFRSSSSRSLKWVGCVMPSITNCGKRSSMLKYGIRALGALNRARFTNAWRPSVLRSTILTLECQRVRFKEQVTKYDLTAIVTTLNHWSLHWHGMTDD